MTEIICAVMSCGKITILYCTGSTILCCISSEDMMLESHNYHELIYSSTKDTLVLHVGFTRFPRNSSLHNLVMMVE